MAIHVKKLVLIAVSVFVSIRVIGWIKETYFFDKFIYQKSTAFGYFDPKTPLSAFGKRVEDLLTLQKFLKSPAKLRVFGATTDHPFTVAIIGDSFVWGQGIRNEDRFAVLLEQKLNTVIPTKVISLGECGADLYNYFNLYMEAQRVMSDIDFYIFGLVDNDVMFNYSPNDVLFNNIDTSIPFKQLAEACRKPISLLKEGDDDNQYSRVFHEAYSDSFGNLCLLDKIIPLLPKRNALYLPLDYNVNDPSIQKLVQPFRQERYPIIMPNYKQYLRPEEYSVSLRESHPSPKMNRAYADILFGEIQKTDAFKAQKEVYFSHK